MNSNSVEILYCHADESADYINPGHWFFHVGIYVQCAQAWESSGKWFVSIDARKYAKPLAMDTIEGDSIEECKAYVAEYFECPVISVSPEDFPRPDE